MKSIFLFTLAVITAHAAPPEKWWSALHQIETGGALGPTIGDNGAALGPYQIHRLYWIDSAVPGRFEDCQDLSYSRKVVTAYLKLYAPKAWAAGDCNVLFRTHNGGPAAMKATGQKKKNLDRYAKKALDLMQ